MSVKSIKVDYLSRVEGEGGLLVKLKGQAVSEVQLKIGSTAQFVGKSRLVMIG